MSRFLGLAQGKSWSLLLAIYFHLGRKLLLSKCELGDSKVEIIQYLLQE